MCTIIRLATLCTMLLWPIQPVWADVVLYLKSQVTPSSEQVKVGDIALVDGSGETGAMIRDMVIGTDLQSDGLVDRNELLSMLSEVISENIIIYGSATRINDPGMKIHGRPGFKKQIEAKRGDTVTVRVNKGGILIEARGTVVESCKRGERVEVEMPGKKKLNGTLAAKGLVEVDL